MRKFNLAEAKQGAQVFTREGDPVRILCFDRKEPNFPIVGLVPNLKGDEEEIETWTVDGSVFCFDVNPSEGDLVMQDSTDI